MDNTTMIVEKVIVVMVRSDVAITVNMDRPRDMLVNANSGRKL